LTFKQHEHIKTSQDAQHLVLVVTIRLPASFDEYVNCSSVKIRETKTNRTKTVLHVSSVGSKTQCFRALLVLQIHTLSRSQVQIKTSRTPYTP